MAKRELGGKRNSTAMKTTTAPDATVPADIMEQRVVAFAEQLGRMVGTVQAKTEGWMDRDALNAQIAGVRDSAAELLDHLAGSVTGLTTSAKKAAGAASKPAGKGRSGGVVDAPGKKHRKPMPADPRAATANAKRATMRSSQASMKTTKKRGRG